METANIKHKVDFILPTKDFKDTTVKELSVEQTFNGHNMEFTVSIPKYLFDELADTEKKYRTYKSMLADKKEREKKGINSFNLDNPDEYLKTKITSPLISSLYGDMQTLTSAAVLKNTKEDLQKTKKIFIRFNHTNRDDRCSWTHGYKGRIISSSFQFFIGYEVMEKRDIFKDDLVANYYTYIAKHSGTTAHKDTGGMEGDKLEPLHYKGERKKFEDTYNIIDWTQEAEDFLTDVQNKFDILYSELYKFLGDLDNNKMKLLIQNSPLKFLEQ